MSVLDQLRAIEQHVEQRLRELAPMVAEYRDLKKVAERLGLKGLAEEPTEAPAPQRTARAKSKATVSRGPTSTAARKTASRAPTRKPTAATSRRSRPSAAKKTASTSSPSHGSASTRAKPKPKAAPAAGSAKAKTATSRRRSAAAPGSRQQDVLRLVSERPGISVSEIAKELDVDATGLYGIVRRLQAKGQIRKDGTALRTVDAAAVTPQPPAAPSSEPTGTQSSATPESPRPPSSEQAATGT
jgi:transposase-like protein